MLFCIVLSKITESYNMYYSTTLWTVEATEAMEKKVHCIIILDKALPKPKPNKPITERTFAPSAQVSMQPGQTEHVFSHIWSMIKSKGELIPGHSRRTSHMESGKLPK